MAEPSAGPVRVSDILKNLATSPRIAQEAREAIGDGIGPRTTVVAHRAHPGCFCISCHRTYRTVP